MFDISYHDKKKNERVRHQVKALEIIWQNFPRYNRKNTVHVDDMSRNFALNPQNGIKVSAFRKSKGSSKSKDNELELLSKYLIKIAAFDDLSALQHSVTEKYLFLLISNIKESFFFLNQIRNGRNKNIPFCNTNLFYLYNNGCKEKIKTWVFFFL